MSIYLGNLSVKQIEERLSIYLSSEERKILIDSREQKAEHIPEGKWHCFDIPFIILCGSMDTAKKIRDILAPYSDKMACKIEIRWQ